MRLASVDERLCLQAENGYHDVERLSGGQFASDPQVVYDVWEAFVDWAARADLADADPGVRRRRARRRLGRLEVELVVVTPRR